MWRIFQIKGWSGIDVEGGKEYRKYKNKAQRQNDTNIIYYDHSKIICRHNNPGAKNIYLSLNDL